MNLEIDIHKKYKGKGEGMNVRIENGKPVFYGEPGRVTHTAVTGTEDVEVGGGVLKRLTGAKTEYTLNADQMNAIGWTIDEIGRASCRERV